MFTTARDAIRSTNPVWFFLLAALVLVGLAVAGVEFGFFLPVYHVTVTFFIDVWQFLVRAFTRIV